MHAVSQLCRDQTILRTAMAALRRAGSEDHTAGMRTKDTITANRAVVTASVQSLPKLSEPASVRIVATGMTRVTDHRCIPLAFPFGRGLYWSQLRLFRLSPIPLWDLRTLAVLLVRTANAPEGARQTVWYDRLNPVRI